MRPNVRWLARYEMLQHRWSVLSAAAHDQGIDVTVNATLANWLDQQFAGHPALSTGEQELYLAWTAAARIDSPFGTEQDRRICLASTQGATALIHHLTRAAAHAPGRIAPAGARSALRRLAARRSELAPLIMIPAQRESAA